MSREKRNRLIFLGSYAVGSFVSLLAIPMPIWGASNAETAAVIAIGGALQVPAMLVLCSMIHESWRAIP